MVRSVPTSRVILLGLLVVGAGCGSVPAAEDGGGGGSDGRDDVDGANDVPDAELRPDAFLGTSPVHALQPLDVGRTWTWQITTDATVFLPGCADGTFEQSVLRAEDVAGRTAAYLEGLCGEGDQGVYLSYGPDSVDQLQGNLWGPYLVAPLADGATWTTADGQTATWHAVPGIAAAGTIFADCWRAVTADFASDTQTEATYCPGVGPVLIEGHQSGRVVVRADLTRFSD